MTGLPITREFLYGCVNRGYNARRLILMPDMPDQSTPFVYNNDDETLEIVMFKSTFKEIFNECHPKLDKFLQEGQVVRDEQHLAELYLVTIGMMLTTNENHSVISIHDDIVMKMLSCSPHKNFCTDIILEPSSFLLRELFLLQTLLNSNIAKINKSSSLWCLLRKLFIYVDSTRSFNKIPSKFFLYTPLASAKMHPSNYYAWNFLTFTINVSKLKATCNFFIECTKDVEKFCKQNLTDSSAWSCYTNIIEMNPAALRMTCEEYNKYSSGEKLEFVHQRVAVGMPSPREKLMDMSKWLWDSKCVSDIPYHAFGRLLIYIVRQWQDRFLVRQIMEQVVVHCSVMEEVWFRKKGLEVVVKHGYFTTKSVDLDKDAVLKEQIQTYANWKRLLNWHTEFVFDRYLRDTLDVKVI
ncbi:CYFA0S03e05754g1_1 [Cyberlindnera fabianii]|uniref:CYFA0S03e05754g1_1 n=1 Tax=Cyberlindnera fabianii TaxID=36022 RepID=A0A061AW86_CYBFA|nr:CYFA0S03e05754g1_1 [Cyberlindnera fabianii]